MQSFRLLALLLLSLLLTVIPARADELKLAVFPSNDPAKLIVPMRILAEYLTENGPDRVTAIITRDYQELLERILDQSIDIAWINSVNYLRLTATTPNVKYIATYMEKNDFTGEITPFYHSFIIALKRSGITTLDQARGRRFAFTDLDSTSGYAYPNMLLKEKGIVPDEYFGKVFFLKRHDRVIEALISGSVDIGAVSDGTYYTAVERLGDIFTVVERSDPIPLDAIVAPSNLSDEKIAWCRRVLTAMPLDHPFNHSMNAVVGWNAAGFAVRDDAFYDTMREALR